MKTSLRSSLLALNLVTILTTPLTSFGNSMRVTYRYDKKPYTSNSHKKNELSFGEAIAVGVCVGVCAAIIGVGCCLYEESDESLYGTCLRRYTTLSEEYGNACYHEDNQKYLARMIVRKSSHKKNHFLRYKHDLDHDIEQLKRDCSSIQNRIYHVKRTLDTSCSDRSSHSISTQEYIDRLQALNNKQHLLLSNLESLRTSVILMKEYRQEEHTKKMQKMQQHHNWMRAETGYSQHSSILYRN